MRPSTRQFVIVFLAVLATPIIVAVVAANASTSCPTLREARAAHPDSHLWWYNDHGGRCWTDHRIAPHPTVRINPLALPKDVAKKPVDANGNASAGRVYDEDEFNFLDEQAGQSPVIAFPSLIRGPGQEPEMLRPQSITMWPLMVDVDAAPTFLPWMDRISGAFDGEKE